MYCQKSSIRRSYQLLCAAGDEFDSLLKTEYPVCYNIAVKIVKMIQNKLQRKVYDSEVVYLTMHIQHFKHYSK